MHLLAAQPGSIEDGGGAVDLGQTPGDVVILSAADSELACLAAAYDSLCAPPFSLRLANLTRLSHPMSVDVYGDGVIAHAKLVVVRLLGGRAYWPYGIERLAALCKARGIALALLPGDGRPDDDLMQDSTIDGAALRELWTYLHLGGIENAAQALLRCCALLGHSADPLPPRPLVMAGAFDADGQPPQGGVLVVFYRALVLAGDLAPIEAVLTALRARGLAARGMWVQSLKDPESAVAVAGMVERCRPDVILNLTAFAASEPGRDANTPFSGADCPVLQVILSSGAEDSWREGTRGLSPRDIAMNVALPEMDGRIITRAVSFKMAERHAPTQCDLARHRPVQDRIDFVAGLAAAWARLRNAPAAERRVALVLANYPNRDGRIGNGVGLDTPAGTIQVLRALAAAGYGIEDIPADGDALMRRLAEGPTNDLTALEERRAGETLDVAAYRQFFATLPTVAQDAILERWGQPEDDPFVRGGRFLLPMLRLGAVALGIQPARGYNVDPARSAHDPALVPPHSYVAFYAWIRARFDAHAVIHMGKHGNMEWLPGKGAALSAQCFPEVCLGPLPHLYPFIVNDPGEGSQAKRRAQAVIIDHLTPPMTRAETYGPLKDLERLVDEYHEASSLDPRRLPVLAKEILTSVSAMALDRDMGIQPGEDTASALTKLDAHLCEIKESQIRDGLHVFGHSPRGEQRTGLLVALARAERGPKPGDRSLIRALAEDFGLGIDPLSGDLAAPWTGPKPDDLAGDSPWRTLGDTVERLEELARALVAGERKAPPSWSATGPVLAEIEARLAPAVDACGAAEIDGLLRGLDGRFVLPGPSGAPTRGRPDVLPTGRNFFAVDTRMVPTVAAWTLGWKSAQLLLERHFQDHGEWPRAVALSAWGTSAMRTGGDDIAQALALLGVRPTWDQGSGRVSGFEILPATLLDRPRVDVTLRVSGFFRDAFPSLMDLVDSAVRAVGRLDEPEDVNPLAARIRADTATLGEDRAAARVFGSMPGAYGAGLQALIDEGGWDGRGDLADAYVAWGSFAYGGGAEGTSAADVFRQRLSQVQAVIHNQDNREHDLLDSDDYYQFEGGLAAAVEAQSGKAPVVWHADHSRPESPRIRTLQEEIARVVRARVVNPKWIAGVMRHGYKGAFEMAASVDYLFAFAATTNAVADHHFDLVAEAYLGDETVRDFLEDHNPAALAEIKARLAEAIERGLWHPRKNSLHGLLEP